MKILVLTIRVHGEEDDIDHIFIGTQYKELLSE